MNSNRSYIVNAIIEWILDNGCTPYIVLDTSIDGVEVPPEGIQKGQITLNVKPSAVRNFILTPDGLAFDARFRGVSKQISAPVAAIVAVFAKENHEGIGFTSEPTSSQSDQAEHTAKPTDSVVPSNTIEFKVTK